MSSLLLFGKLMTWLHPLWMVAVGMLIAAAVLSGIFLLLRLAMPKMAAVASTTTKEALSQPLFYVVMVLGIILLLLFPYMSYFTLGEDIVVLKTEGVTLIMVLSMMLALWMASVSIAEEIEGRTALTLLSKPISRRQFIVGKFLGVVGTVAILFIILGALFLATVSYKVVYDARETAQPEPTRQDCQDEMLQIVPGLALALMETIVIASISVAISTRLPMLPNLIICVSIYMLGHMVPLLVGSSVGQLEHVRFVAGLLATILPVLDHFNVYTAISTGGAVPLVYLAWAAAYCILYSTAAMLLALLLFEDRDLA